MYIFLTFQVSALVAEKTLTEEDLMNLHPHSEHGEAERPKESMNMEQLVQVNVIKRSSSCMNFLFVKSQRKNSVELNCNFCSVPYEKRG